MKNGIELLKVQFNKTAFINHFHKTEADGVFILFTDLYEVEYR